MISTRSVPVPMLRNTLAYLLARVVPGAVNLATLMLLSRRLSASEYGEYALAVAYGTMASALAFHWLCQGVSRYAAAWEAKRDTFLRCVFGAYLLTGLALVATVPVLGTILAGTIHLQIIVGVLALALMQGMFDTVGNLNIAELKAGRYSRMAIFRAVATFLAVLVLTGLGYGYHAAMGGLLIGLGTAVVLFNFHTIAFVVAPRLDPAPLRQIARQGVPLGIHYTLTLLGSLADRAIIGYFLGAADTGLYSAGADLVQRTLGVVMFAVYLGFYPAVVRAREANDAEACLNQLRNGLSSLLAIGAPVVTGMIMISGNFTHVLLGGTFEHTAADLLPIFAVTALAYALKTLYFDIPFILEGRGAVLITLTLLSSALSVVLITLLVPIYGIAAAALTAAFSATLSALMSAWVGRRIMPLPCEPSKLVAILVATMAMAAAVWPIRNMTGPIGLAIQTATGMLVYGLAAIVLLRFAPLKRKLGHGGVGQRTSAHSNRTDE